MGELKKLKIKPPSRNTIKRILRNKGFDPSPKRSDSTWAEFLERHAKTLWQCDLLMKKIVTWRGIRYAYVWYWINVKSRRVYSSPVTYKPTQEWTAMQTMKTLDQIRASGDDPRLVQFDHDTRFGEPFKEILDLRGIEKVQTVYRSPNLNAYIERFIQTLQVECLDHFIIFGQKHFDYLVNEFLEYYHKERPHQSLDNVPPDIESTSDEDYKDGAIPISKIRCKEGLGGLLKSYSRAA